MSAEIILHHYPQSFVSEKVRLVLGIKELPWHSVEIPRMPPKPDLMPLTGGYRLTPVMQIGSDVYCDSQIIIREIQRRHPEPTLFPGGGGGMVWGIGRWTDEILFKIVLRDVFGRKGSAMPREFLDDRLPLFFEDGATVEQLAGELGHNRDQIRAQFGFMDERIGAGRKFMLGDHPSLSDAFCYYLIWFFRHQDPDGPRILEEFEHLLAWEARMRAIGHGRPTPMDSKRALEIARATAPMTREAADPRDPRGLKPGDRVEIISYQCAGAGAVKGVLVASDAQEVAILRRDELVGDIVVHFPRAGYRVNLA